MKLPRPYLSMLVPAKPQLTLSSLVGGETSSLRSPWRDCSFYPSGGHALAASLKTLRLRAGASVALPALICRSVPDWLTQLGYTPQFVDSSADSPNPTVEALGQACFDEATEMLLLVDLFGFFPEGRSEAAVLARAKGCVVVEDRCHSALTRPAEEVADAIIYSIRKSLPCSDGGALWFAKKEKVCDPPPLPMPSLLKSMPFIIARQLERLVCWLGWPNIYSETLTARRNTHSSAEVDQHGSALRVILSEMPSWLLRHQLCQAALLTLIAERRRTNYYRLATELHSVAPLFKLLEGGEVPQVLPIADPSCELVDYLRDRGVGAYRWPGNELPAKVFDDDGRFPNARRWNREIVCLPIHHTIKERHIERMVELIERFASAGG